MAAPPGWGAPQGYPGQAPAGYPQQPGYYPPPQQQPAYPGYPPASAPGYGAPPAPGYGAPPPGYGAPQPGYGAPPPGYGAPAGYGAPPPGWGAPAPGAPGGAPGYPQQAPTLYEFQFGATNLDRKDIMSKTDPFFQISASTNPTKHTGKLKAAKKSKDMKKVAKGKASSWSVVYKSEQVPNNQNPTFKPFTLDLMLLCGNNFDQPFLMEVYDFDANGRHDLVGKAMTTMRELQVLKEFQLKNKNRRGFGDVAGMVRLIRAAPYQAVPTLPGGSGGATHPPQHGAPPQQYGAPPQGYGAPPQNYGAQPGQPQGYPPAGHPPQGSQPNVYGPPGTQPTYQAQAQPGSYGAPPGASAPPAGQQYLPTGPGQYSAQPPGHGAPPPQQQQWGQQAGYPPQQ